MAKDKKKQPEVSFHKGTCRDLFAWFQKTKLSTRPMATIRCATGSLVVPLSSPPTGLPNHRDVPDDV
jgi:hypothetical protein